MWISVGFFTNHLLLCLCTTGTTEKAAFSIEAMLKLKVSRFFLHVSFHVKAVVNAGIESRSRMMIVESSFWLKNMTKHDFCGLKLGKVSCTKLLSWSQIPFSVPPAAVGCQEHDIQY